MFSASVKVNIVFLMCCYLIAKVTQDVSLGSAAHYMIISISYAHLSQEKKINFHLLHLCIAFSNRYIHHVKTLLNMQFCQIGGACQLQPCFLDIIFMYNYFSTENTL